MKEKWLAKLQSPVVWIAVIAQIAVIVGLFMPDLAAEVKTAGAAVVEILTVFGLLNNPDSREGF